MTPPPTPVNPRERDWLDEQPFYEAMQAYRLAPLISQDAVIEAFEAIKTMIRVALSDERERCVGIVESRRCCHLGCSDFGHQSGCPIEIAAAIRKGEV